MQWVDEVVSWALKRKRNHYWVTDWITPSGKVHAGSLRGVVIHDAVAKALAKHKPTTFQYGFDDFDPMDGIPVYLDAHKYRQHFGKPLSTIPSPEPGYANFGEYYAKDFLRAIHAVGSNPKIVWSSKIYKSGKFNEAIKIVLENAKKVNEIWQDISGSKREYLPIQMVCQNCGSIFHTRALSWEGKQVSYSCSNCKFKGKGSPFDGGAKLPWRVEWAAKWMIFKSDVEGAGKDHNTKGGSHDVAAAIAQKIFNIEVPVNIVYEFLLIEGKKMAGSKGLGISATELIEIAPPEIVRYIMETRPNRAIEFNPKGDTISRLFDEYDKTQAGYRMRFSKVAWLEQMPHVEVAQMARQEKGKPLNAVETLQLKTRVDYVKKWLATYAPEDFKLMVQQTLPAVELSQKQKQFLAKLAGHFAKHKKWQGGALHTAIHDLKNEMDISPADAFQAIYKIFLNKTSGPQAGWFLAALDRKFVLKRLKEAAK